MRERETERERAGTWQIFFGTLTVYNTGISCCSNCKVNNRLLFSIFSLALTFVAVIVVVLAVVIVLFIFLFISVMFTNTVALFIGSFRGLQCNVTVLLTFIIDKSLVIREQNALRVSIFSL